MSKPFELEADDVVKDWERAFRVNLTVEARENLSVKIRRALQRAYNTGGDNMAASVLR